jgi:1-acyl-sn-glycerol-3-phosphate acyltransferase
MIAGVIRLITGARARWVGIDPTRDDGSLPQRVYFANHGSHLDVPVIWASLPIELRRLTRPVAARDYWDATALRRKLAKGVFRSLLIDRKKVTATHNPIGAMEEALAAGDSLILFPEGTRTTDEEGAMGEFKAGLWHLFRKCPQVQFVPVYLENLNRILPKGDFLLIPFLAAVTFGAPLATVEGEDKQAFLLRARAAVESLSDAAEVQK